MDGDEFKVISFSDSFAFTLYHNETAFQQTHFSNFVYVCHEACFNRAHKYLKYVSVLEPWTLRYIPDDSQISVLFCRTIQLM